MYCLDGRGFVRAHASESIARLGGVHVQPVNSGGYATEAVFSDEFLSWGLYGLNRYNHQLIRESYLYLELQCKLLNNWSQYCLDTRVGFLTATLCTAN
jgi:hypothetical protein